MASLATTLGLRSANPLILGGPIANKSPYYILFHFLLAYVFTASRPAKIYMKLDHNVSPREDLTKHGEQAVKSGKITQRQLDFLKRTEGCHANSMDHFPVFVTAVVFGMLGGVENGDVNRACLWYTAWRLIYVVTYLTVERSERLARIRSIAWWGGNVICMRLLRKAGKLMGA